MTQPRPNTVTIVNMPVDAVQSLLCSMIFTMLAVSTVGVTHPRTQQQKLGPRGRVTQLVYGRAGISTTLATLQRHVLGYMKVGASLITIMPQKALGLVQGVTGRPLAVGDPQIRSFPGDVPADAKQAGGERAASFSAGSGSSGD